MYLFFFLGRLVLCPGCCLSVRFPVELCDASKILNLMKTKTTYSDLTNFVLSSINPVMLIYLYLPHLKYKPVSMSGLPVVFCAT